jgi:hypothetical protein
MPHEYDKGQYSGKVRGHDDHVGSDFLCIGFEKQQKSFIPNLKLLFWVQTKSQSSRYPSKIGISSRAKVDSILNNKIPYFIAIVNTRLSPTVSLYGTLERIAFRHMCSYSVVKKLYFIPGIPNDNIIYRFVESNHITEIYMGNPFLEFKVAENYARIGKYWEILKGRIEKEYKNFIYAAAGLGAYEREPLPWAAPGEEKKIFYPINGQLTEETGMSISIALEMLNLTLIDRERKGNPNSELVKAMDFILQHFTHRQA